MSKYAGQIKKDLDKNEILFRKAVAEDFKKWREVPVPAIDWEMNADTILIQLYLYEKDNKLGLIKLKKDYFAHLTCIAKVLAVGPLKKEEYKVGQIVSISDEYTDVIMNPDYAIHMEAMKERPAPEKKLEPEQFVGKIVALAKYQFHTDKLFRTDNMPMVYAIPSSFIKSKSSLYGQTNSDSETDSQPNANEDWNSTIS